MNVLTQRPDPAAIEALHQELGCLAVVSPPSPAPAAPTLEQLRAQAMARLQTLPRGSRIVIYRPALVLEAE